MLVIKLQGGLGNQMFQYALGRALSLKKKTSLFFDISSYVHDPLRKYALDVFPIEQNIASDTEVNRFRKFQRKTGKFRFFWNICIADRKKYMLEKQFHFDPSVFGIRDDAYIDGYWNSEKYFKNIRTTLLADFTVKNPLSGKNKDVAENILKTNAVSIHVRRGDYAHDPKTNHVWGTLGTDYYDKALNILSPKVTDPHFFVFSDEIEWAKTNLKLPPHTTYIDWNTSEPHEDLRLMNLCKHHIIANSTFSWWGAWLAQNKEQIVIAPKKWFNNTKPNVKTHDVLPEGWIKI